MKAWKLGLGLLLVAMPLCSATLPQNSYMRAMQDEIKRSMAKLRRPGVEKPYFIAYKLEQITQEEAAASFGALYPTQARDSQLNAYVWVDIGSAQKDSMGFAHAAYYPPYAYRPQGAKNMPKSYSGVRQALWQLTDEAYTFAAETYQQKQAYERAKQTPQKDKLPDVLEAKQANYVEAVKTFATYDWPYLQNWVKAQSALGKELPFVEQFLVQVSPVQKDTYYLNSRGGFYQKSVRGVQVQWQAQMRSKDGFKRKYRRRLWLTDFTAQEAALAAKTTQRFLTDLQAYYKSVKGENYVGPVLLTPGAAGPFLYEELIKNFQNVKGLLFEGDEPDETLGKFNVEGQRVLAPGITVWDEPHARARGNTPLGGFMPVDDEGVAAQTLKLVEKGRTVQLPRTTRPLADKKHSNGHACATPLSMPRECLTNVRVEPENPVPWDGLVERLLARCQELGLPYGYILHAWPGPDTDNQPVWERVYTDGRREFVYGLKIDGLTTRSLRDILAAGDEPAVSHLDQPGEAGLPAQNVSTPALLLEEMELVTLDNKPDQKPFVKKP